MAYDFLKENALHLNTHVGGSFVTMTRNSDFRASHQTSLATWRNISPMNYRGGELLGLDFHRLEKQEMCSLFDNEIQIARE
jgi:hypothetical protein